MRSVTNLCIIGGPPALLILVLLQCTQVHCESLVDSEKWQLVSINLPFQMRGTFQTILAPTNLTLVNLKIRFVGLFFDDFDQICDSLCTLNRPIALIEGRDGSCYEHHLLVGLSQRLKIPLLRLGGSDTPPACRLLWSHSLQVNFGPSLYLIEKALTTMIETRMRVGLFYEERDDLRKFTSLLEKLPGQAIIKEWDEQSIKQGDSLREFQELRAFIVDLSPQNATAFLALMSSLKMSKTLIHIINQNPRLHKLNNFAFSDWNMTIYSLHYKNLSETDDNQSWDYYILSLLAKQVQMILEDIQLDLATVHPPEPTCADSNYTFALPMVRKLIDGLERDVGFWSPPREPLKEYLNYSLIAISVQENSYEKYATYNLQSGLHPIKSPWASKRDQYINNITLRVTTIVDPPFVIYRHHDEYGKKLEGNDRWTGLTIELLKRLSQLTKFRFKIHNVTDNKFGVKNETTNEWNGMIGELLTNKADLAAASLTITYDREKVIDFTTPYISLGLSIIIKKSKPAGDLFQFMAPLSKTVWGMMIAAYICVSFVLFLVGRLSPYEWYRKHPCSHMVENQFSIWNSFWFTVGSLMQQGCDVNPKATSTRIISTVWWFFILIMISSYTANLAAFLTIERLHSDIENVEDLSRQNKIKYGTIKDGSTYAFFRNTKIDTYKRMYNFMRSDPNVYVKNNQEGIARVKEKPYAFILESTFNEYHTQRNCELMQLGGLLDSRGYGLGLPAGFTRYRDIFSEAILQLQKDQFIENLRRAWLLQYNVQTPCYEKSSTEPKSRTQLSLSKIGGAFFGLGVGLLTAVVVCLVEVICWTLKMKYKYKKPMCSKLNDQIHLAFCSCSSKTDEEDDEINGQVDKITYRLTRRLNGDVNPSSL